VTARALRRTLAGDVDAFPQDVLELMAYFQEPQPGQAVRAVPGSGLNVPVWILGSSLFGAQLAAALGLPYAFASHFAPAQMMDAIRIYRENFRPSSNLAAPYVMLGVNVIAADTDEEARRLLTSLQQAFVNLRRGRPGLLPPPVAGFDQQLDPFERLQLEQVLSASVVGSPETVRLGLEQFVSRTGADEVIIAAQIFDHAARLRSYEIAARARDQLKQSA
jgi:luciferase family oxidoreductase group 1